MTQCWSESDKFTYLLQATCKGNKPVYKEALRHETDQEEDLTSQEQDQEHQLTPKINHHLYRK